MKKVFVKIMFLACLPGSVLLAEQESVRNIVKSLERMDICKKRVEDGINDLLEHRGQVYQLFRDFWRDVEEHLFPKYSSEKEYFPKLKPLDLVTLCSSEELEQLDSLFQCVSQKMCEWSKEMMTVMKERSKDPLNHIYEGYPQQNLESCRSESLASFQLSCRQAMSRR